MPKDEKAIEAKAITIIASAGLTIVTPEKIANGKIVTAARISPKKNPAIVLPKMIVNKETGATSSLSKVPVCLSKTTATASIDVVPKSIDKDESPATIRTGFMFPAMLNAKNNETGIKSPKVKLGALK
jgi:hypothetical protein